MRDAALLDQARAEDARLRMDLEAVPPLVPLVWPLREPRGMFSTTTAERIWSSLRRRNPTEVSEWMWVAQDWMLHAQRVLLPVRRGRGSVEPYFLIRRTAAYYDHGSGGVALDRRPYLTMLVNQFRIKPFPARHLIAAGVKIEPGATSGYYVIDEDQRMDLYVVVRALEGYGHRLPANVVPPRISRAASPATEFELKLTSTRIRCPSPDHDDERPSAELHASGAVYCYGCREFVGEWRDATIRDWSRPVRYDRSLREQEKEQRAGLIPDTVVIRLYVAQGRNQQEEQVQIQKTTESTTPALRLLEAPEVPSEKRSGRGGRRVGAGRKGEDTSPHTHRSCISYDGPAKPDMRSVFVKAATAGQPGPHPVDHLAGHAGAHLEEECWQNPADRYPLPEVWSPTGLEVRDLRDARRVGYVRGVEYIRGGMLRRYDRQIDLIEVQRQADRWSRRSSTSKTARQIYDELLAHRPNPHPHDLVNTDVLARLPKDLVENLGTIRQQYISMGCWDYVLRPGATSVRFKGEVCTRYVLIDIDDVILPDPTAGIGLEAAARAEMALEWRTSGLRHERGAERGQFQDHGDRALVSAVERIQAHVDQLQDLTGRLYIVRTGPTGVQVGVELRETRWDTHGLYHCADFKSACARLGDAVLQELRAVGCSGGEVDQKVWRPKSLGRRCGWRLAKDGSLFRSRLIYATNRAPWRV